MILKSVNATYRSHVQFPYFEKKISENFVQKLSQILFLMNFNYSTGLGPYRWSTKPNPNQNQNQNQKRKIVPKSRIEPKSKKFVKSKSKIGVSLPDNNIFNSFFTNHSHMLCYMFTPPLVFILHTIIELLTHSIFELQDQKINLSKLKIFTSFGIPVYKTMYCSLSIISDWFLLELEKWYRKNIISPQVQRILLLRKRI